MGIPTGLEILDRTNEAPALKITGYVEPASNDPFGGAFRKATPPAPRSELLGKAVKHQGKAATVRFVLDSECYGHGAVLQYADHSWGWCERADIDRDLEEIS